jgi:hypothetical protein
MKIGRGERVYTSYIFKLRDGSFVKLLAKELVNGKLDLARARISVEKMVKNGFKSVFAYLYLLWIPLMSVS